MCALHKNHKYCASKLSTSRQAIFIQKGEYSLISAVAAVAAAAAAVAAIPN